MSTDALHSATENIRKKIYQNEYVTAAFLDLSKAFDSISHSTLFRAYFRTILGPLLLNIYVNRMKEFITEKRELIQYADDAMTFSANTNEKEALKNLEENIKKLKNCFVIHSLTINADKTEFITFCKISKNNIVRDMEI